MADLRKNGWSGESFKCQPDLDLFDTSGEESILVSDCSGGFGAMLFVHSSFATI